MSLTTTIRVKDREAALDIHTCPNGAKHGAICYHIGAPIDVRKLLRLIEALGLKDKSAVCQAAQSKCQHCGETITAKCGAWQKPLANTKGG